jgi:hypothetical protein
MKLAITEPSGSRGEAGERLSRPVSGFCVAKISNRLPTVPGWNYMVRLYRPRAENPELDAIRKLSSLKAKSDDARFAAVAARQARNRVCHAIEQAAALLDDALSDLE